MSKNPNTYLKQQREIEKKRKAEEKRARRQKKKESDNAPSDSGIANPSDSEE